jgi:hypothetical protein
MKKSLLALTLLTAMFFACKKKTTSDLTPTDVTGSTTVQGVCTKNIISPNGAGGWISSNTVPAAGVLVQIKVNKNQLYPNSVATGADVYSATTGTNGVWSMSVKSNATGVQAYMTMTGFNGTQDTLINGNYKTGLWANYFGPNPTNLLLVMGTTYDYGLYQFNATNLTSFPNNIMIGSAMVSGSVSAREILKTVVTGTAASTSFGFTNIAVPANTTVYMTLTNDPTTLAPKMYQTTTDATGHYSFTFPTVASGTTGFPQNATIWVSDRADSQDTVNILNGSNNGTTTGLSGVHQSASTNQGALFNNEIRNATNIYQNAFTPN